MVFAGILPCPYTMHQFLSGLRKTMIKQWQQLEQKIVDLNVWHLALPVTSRRDHGIGSVENNMEVVIVELISEGGNQGFGEASPWAVFTGTPEASYAAIDRYFRPLLQDTRLCDFNQQIELINRTVMHCTEAKSAIESAWLDLTGRILNKPAWSLLGQACRDRAPLSVSLANPDFSCDIELLERLTDDRIGVVKLKTGFKDDAFDQMRAEYIRKHFPSMALRIDYNQGLETATALQSVQKIDYFEPDFIEQPVRYHEFAAMTEIRRHIRAPLLADESVFGPEDMQRAIRENICNGVSIKIMKSGGIGRGLRTAQIAASAGLPAYGGDMFETGLAHLAGMQLMALGQNISLGCEYYHSTYYLVEDILEAPIKIENGHMLVPEGSGLGIGVNRDMLDKYSINNA